LIDVPTQAPRFNVLDELNEAIIFYGTKGLPVKIEGVGVFSPVIKIDGTFRIGFRFDTIVSKALNVQGAFSGSVVNAANIGMTLEEMIER
jgi:hypothetical protein